MLASAPQVYGEAFSRGIRPPPILTVSEWSQEHRVLSGRAASERGPWRNERTPYLVEIMDALSSSSPVEEVDFVKGSQVGGTEALLNWIGYTIDHDPAPLLYVMPGDRLCKRTSRTRIQPMIDDSPRLSALVASPRSKEGGNSMLEKEFPGGVLIMTGAESGANLRSTPVKKLLLDELDAFPQEIDEEGDPAILAERGTRNFPDRKIARVSTPTEEGRSKISESFERSDQSYYHVPCPDCGHYQRLVWKRPDGSRGIVYEVDDEGEPINVRFACEACGSLIPEHKKTWMLKMGKWVATHPERSKRHRGFHLSALYSPIGFYSWVDIVRAFLKAEGKPSALRIWVNQTLGETWKIKSSAPKWERLYNRREDYKRGTIPEGVALVTAGVDVQGDRFEVEWVGWGRGLESWSIDYQVIDGDPAEDSTWERVEKMLERTFQRGPLDIHTRLTAIDSGFESNVVKDWVRGKDPTRFIAIRGVEGRHMFIGTPQLQDIKLKSGKRLKRSVRVWPIDVGEGKSELYAWLRKEAPTNPEEEGWPRGWCHFPQYGEEHFKQLTAERLEPERNARGFLRYLWKKRRERNEALDCRVYARAAAALVGVDRWDDDDWDAALAKLGTVRAEKPAKGGAGAKGRAKRRREGDGEGDWLSRWR